MAIVELSQGKVSVVDAEDFERVSKYKWTYTEPGYAYRNDYTEGRRRVYLHRFVLGEPQGGVVDHINHDKLDNRRSNLRLCTHSENISNSESFAHNTSGYRGVSWDKNRGKWLSYLSTDGKSRQVGRFYCKEAAALARNVLIIKSDNSFAKQNDVQSCNCAECVSVNKSNT